MPKTIPLRTDLHVIATPVMVPFPKIGEFSKEKYDPNRSTVSKSIRYKRCTTFLHTVTVTKRIKIKYHIFRLTPVRLRKKHLNRNQCARKSKQRFAFDLSFRTCFPFRCKAAQRRAPLADHGTEFNLNVSTV
jgi:hypothetical protein